MEETLGIKYYKTSHGTRNGKPLCGWENQTTYAMARYADDFVIMCEKREDADKVYSILEKYLIKRGLELQLEKTKITNVWDGFDFLGFNIRRYQHKTVRNCCVNPQMKVLKSANRKSKIYSFK